MIIKIIMDFTLGVIVTIAAFYVDENISIFVSFVWGHLMASIFYCQIMKKN